MIYRKEPTEFERRWLERIDQRSERQSEWKRLRGIQRHRRLYRLGMITLGFCVALLAGVVVFIVLVLVLHLLFLL
jgi:tetrahydromethanopterin S-methyltransferase subunit F